MNNVAWINNQSDIYMCMISFLVQWNRGSDSYSSPHVILLDLNALLFAQSGVAEREGA